MAWENCNIKLEFAKKVIIQSQITILHFMCGSNFCKTYVISKQPFWAAKCNGVNLILSLSLTKTRLSTYKFPFEAAIWSGFSLDFPLQDQGWRPSSAPPLVIYKRKLSAAFESSLANILSLCNKLKKCLLEEQGSFHKSWTWCIIWKH